MNVGIIHLVIEINWRIWHAIHNCETAAKSVPGKAFHIIITNSLIAVDNSDPTGVVDAIAKKHIVFNYVAIAVAQCQRAS